MDDPHEPAIRIVLSACGHWWREPAYPADMDDDQGEYRECPGHRERMRFPVVYLPNAPLAKYRVVSAQYAGMDPYATTRALPGANGASSAI